MNPLELGAVHVAAVDQDAADAVIGDVWAVAEGAVI